MGDAQAEGERAFDIEGEIGQHRAHQRLVDEAALEGAAVADPVMGRSKRAAHQAGRGHGRVEPGVMHHFDDGAHALAGLAELIGQRVGEFDLGGGVGLVAQLVLEALDVDRVAFALEPAGDEEAGQAVRSLCQRQETVGHRRRAEPFVAGQPPVIAVLPCLRGIGAYVRSALFLGHCHAERRTRFRGDGFLRGVIGPGGEFRAPFGGKAV